MKIILIVAILLATYLNGNCQMISRSVVGSNGGFTTDSATRLQFTVGEAVVVFLKAGGDQFSEGYQQDDSVSYITTSLNDLIAPVCNLILTPNPANQKVNLRYDIPSDCFISCSIYDCLGRLCLKCNSGKRFSGSNADEIDLSNFVSGTYILRVWFLSDDFKFMKSLPLVITK